MSTKIDEVTIAHDNNLILSSREIFLFTKDEHYVGNDLALEFIKNLRILENKNHNPIIIHQNSVGGCSAAGMAIYDAILNSPCQFLFLCYGYVASMGSIIPQAVHNKGYRITTKHSNWLIHEMSINLDNSFRSAKSYGESAEILQNKIYDIYANVCYKAPVFGDDTISRVKSYIKHKLTSKHDWWLTGEEAVNHGFADAVLGSKDYETIDKIKSYL